MATKDKMSLIGMMNRSEGLVVAKMLTDQGYTQKGVLNRTGLITIYEGETEVAVIMDMGGAVAVRAIDGLFAEENYLKNR